MRAKACTTCRQWKARCDATPGVAGGCSRCRSLKQPCVFDASFKRTSKNKCLQQMSSEIQQLRQALLESNRNTSSSASPASGAPSSSNQATMNDEASFTADWQPGLSGNPGSTATPDHLDPRNTVTGLQQPSPMSARASPQEILELQQTLPDPTKSDTSSNPIATTAENAFSPDWQPHYFVAPSHTPGLPSSSSALVHQSALNRRLSSSTPYRILGDVGLTRGQVEEQFRSYFAYYHQYLPFKMASTSPEEIYAKCSLLFWVIIAVASTRKLRARLSPMIRALVSEAMYSRTQCLEVVQALLILCIWPFGSSSLNEDPSYLYSGMATQICYQLGLHCHQQGHTHLTLKHPQLDRPDEVKLTTWLSTYLVNQILSNSLGLPPSMTGDYNLIDNFSHSALDPTISKMCRIYHLLVQASLDISGYTPTSATKPDPSTRLKMIITYGTELSTLQARHLDPMGDMLKILYLNSRAQLWSFALAEDMPISPKQLDIVKQAERDSCDLIELCYSLNLSLSPSYVRRAMCYSAFVLAKILRSQQATQCEVLEDYIEKVRQALMSTSDSRGDITHKACELLQSIPYIEDKRLSPTVTSRMGQSVLYDLLRIGAENAVLGTQLEQRITASDMSFDLDGFNWDMLGM
ncbi:suppressor protein sef1 [Orbilia ellipsospora]|uniref:Suppressor protein sef1 n=1 Tax=Orbilia ellipsospora TaxID=2528407 RepID=A0AAV9WY27_9PEZI